MRSSFLKTVLLILTFSQSCKDKEPVITNTHELSPEMMSYFVNFEVGTKWIYQDTINIKNYDTIELVSKKNFDVVIGNGTLQKGFELYYQPKKSKDYKVFVSVGVNNTYYVKVDPLVTSAGKIVFENNNGTWTTGVTYFDSLEFTGTKYYNIIESKSTNSYQYLMKISKSNGIVFFYHMNGGAILAAYKLIKRQMP